MGDDESLAFCEKCRPDIFEECSVRHGENHFSSDLGDYLAEVRKDGELLRNVRTVWAGPGGGAIVYVLPMYNGELGNAMKCPCESGQAAMVYYESDDFSVSSGGRFVASQRP